MPSNKSNRDSLLTGIKARTVAVVVGAGVSKAAGAPLWNEVTNELLDRFASDAEQRNAYQSLEPYRLLEVLGHTYSRRDLTSALHAVFDPKSKTPHEVHKLAVQIPFATIISTNWDSLIEDAWYDVHHEYACPILCDADLRGSRRSQLPALIKPHGDLASDRTQSQGHVYTFDKRSPGIAAHLQSLLFSHSLLFLGYSFRDPDFLSLYYSFVHAFGDLMADLWPRHYVFVPGDEASGEAELFRAMHLNVITGDCKPSDPEEKKTAALMDVLQWLSDRTSTVVHKEGRSKRMVQFLENAKGSLHNRELRVRGGLSPLATPEKEPKHLKASPWDAKEYDLQVSLRESFDQVVRSAKRTYMIVSTDMDSLQQRATNRAWLIARLKALIDYFDRDERDSDRGTGEQAADHTRRWELLNKIFLVDRFGPYEIQEYIIGDSEEKAESRKLRTKDRSYYETKITTVDQDIRDAAKLFDSCFETWKTDNVGRALRSSSGDAIAYLTHVIRRYEPLHDEAQAKANVLRLGLREDEAKKLADDIAKFLAEVSKVKTDENRLKQLIAKQRADVLVATVGETYLQAAIRAHLVEMWRKELDSLQQDRTPEAQIRIERYAMDTRTDTIMEKGLFHQLLPSAAPPPEEAVRNWHASALGLTWDRRLLLLRKRPSKGKHFDHGKYDRTFSGHVPPNGTFETELKEELRHYFGSERCLLLEPDSMSQFRATPGEELPEDKAHTVALPLTPESDDYIREGFTREKNVEKAADKDVDKDTVFVHEPVVGSCYLCRLPFQEIDTLPDPAKHTHCDGWIGIDRDRLQRLLAGETVNVPKEHARLMAKATEPYTVSGSELTREAAHLLEKFGDTLLDAMEPPR